MRFQARRDSVSRHPARASSVGSGGAGDSRVMAPFLSVAFALALVPGRPVLTIARPASMRARMMVMDPPERIKRMEAAVAELELLE